MRDKSEEEEILCEWCEVKPYYISIHNEEGNPQEELICKECYQQGEWE